MTTYLGTVGNDVIDGRIVAGERDRIDALGGDDTVTLGPNQTFVSGPGNDTVVGSKGTSQYGLWFATSKPYVDLAQGYATDGGGTDQISGIGVVHLPGLGGTVIGTSANETVFVFGGQNVIDLAGGTDRVIYYQLPSTNYEISKDSTGYQLRNLATNVTDSIKNVEFIKFTDRLIDVAYDAATVKAAFQYTAYEFHETRMAPGYTYAGVAYPPSLVSWFVQAPYTLDLDGDGRLDLVAPLNMGYSTGLDTRVPFIALTGSSGTLQLDAAINAEMPVTAGARRQADIFLSAINKDAVITVAHDTGDGKIADLTLLTDGLDGLGPNSPIRLPLLPAALPGRDWAVNAHSMAVGDINGDGLDDVLIGDWGNSTGAYALLQQADGLFRLQRQDLFTSITLNWPMDSANAGQGNNILVDLALVDVNGDGYDDLVAGWGHGSTHSYVFINNMGSFSVANKIALPDSIYGEDNQLHMKTLAYDFDGDGIVDLAILRSRYVPFYGGNYIQLLHNDGKGNFTDVTSSRIDKPAQDAFGDRLQWTDYWQLLDVNADGAMDIVGQRTGSSSAPVIYLNDGSGNFRVIEVPTNQDVGSVIRWADFDHDGKLEFVTFRSIGDATGSSATNQFDVFELAADSFTSSDTKTGSSLSDELIGNGNNNTLIGNAGNDTLDGGAGIDTAVFSVGRANYTVTHAGASYTVKALAGADGTDTLQNVERLKFTDGSIALDVGATQPAGEAQLLLGATLGKDLLATKQPLIGAVIDLFDRAYTLQQLSGAVMRLPIWAVLTDKAAPTNTDIATYLLTNVNNMVPDATTLANAVSALNTETDFATQGNFLWHLAESGANQTRIDLVGLASTGLAYTV